MTFEVEVVQHWEGEPKVVTGPYTLWNKVQAADYLNVSINNVERMVPPDQLEPKRWKFSTLQALIQEIEKDRQEALENLAKTTEEMGLYGNY